MSYDRLEPTISSKTNQKKLFGSGNMGQNNWRGGAPFRWIGHPPFKILDPRPSHSQFHRVHKFHCIFATIYSSAAGRRRSIGVTTRSEAHGNTRSDYNQGCSGVVRRGRGGRRPPTFLTGDASPTPPLFGHKFVQKLVHCCNLLLTETQCKIISVGL